MEVILLHQYFKNICLPSPQLFKACYYVCLSFLIPLLIVLHEKQWILLRLRKTHLQNVGRNYKCSEKQFLLNHILNSRNYCGYIQFTIFI
jgi:hypothetical protein